MSAEELLDYDPSDGLEEIGPIDPFDVNESK
jgi:hypothetical protein